MLRRYIQGFVIAVSTILALTSCNKEIIATKVINVTFHGYNISDMLLEVTLDTVVFDKKIQPANARIDFSMVYPYFPGKKEAILRVKDQVSGKELLQKTLPLSGEQLEFHFNLLNINGNLVDVTLPAADTGTNKLGFYIYYPESNDSIDIILYNPTTGQFVYLAQNVVPQTWVYTDYLPTEWFMKKNDVESSIIYFTKAGTLDQWAFNDSESLSQTTAFSWFLPYAGYNLNKVQPYFILPSAQGWSAEAVNLFPVPKQY